MLQLLPEPAQFPQRGNHVDQDQDVGNIKDVYLVEEVIDFTGMEERYFGFGTVGVEIEHQENPIEQEGRSMKKIPFAKGKRRRGHGFGVKV